MRTLRIYTCLLYTSKAHDAANIVVDPVMVSTSGSRLLAEDAVETLKTQLLPVADLITPNIPEAEVLTGIEITGREDMQLSLIHI